MDELFWQDLLITLSTLLRGSIYEKLRWTFKLYDINGDGCITKGELGEVVNAVHELMGRKHPADEERKAKDQLDRVFTKLDLNQDGVVTIEEFMESCLKVRINFSYPLVRIYHFSQLYYNNNCLKLRHFCVRFVEITFDKKCLEFRYQWPDLKSVSQFKTFQLKW